MLHNKLQGLRRVTPFKEKTSDRKGMSAINSAMEFPDAFKAILLQSLAREQQRVGYLQLLRNLNIVKVESCRSDGRYGWNAWLEIEHWRR
jgi:hypothetical protein